MITEIKSCVGLNDKVTSITLGDNLPWYAKGMEGQTVDVVGGHENIDHSRWFVIAKHIPDDNHCMFFEQHHIIKYHVNGTLI